MTINTPYPGTETWLTESRRFTTRDYRLFDVQHAVLPTRLPLRKFYEEFVKTQDVLNQKHLGWQAVCDVFGITLRLLAQGQTNFLQMLWKFSERLQRRSAHARPRGRRCAIRSGCRRRTQLRPARPPLGRRALHPSPDRDRGLMECGGPPPLWSAVACHRFGVGGVRG